MTGIGEWNGMAAVGCVHSRCILELLEWCGVRMCGVGNEGEVATLIGLGKAIGGGRQVILVVTVVLRCRRGKAAWVKAGLQKEAIGCEAEA